MAKNSNSCLEIVDVTTNGLNAHQQPMNGKENESDCGVLYVLYIYFLY